MRNRNLLLCSVSLVFAASLAFGFSWEDAVYVQPAAPVVLPRSQAPQRVRDTLPPVPTITETDYALDLYSQHLDANTRHVYSYGVSYTAETQFGPFGATDIVEAEFEFRLFHFNEFLNGSFDAWVSAHVIGFIENPDIDALPDALINFGLDIGQCWRFVNGWSTEIRAVPGIYSDIAEPAFGIPLTLNFYFAVNPELSIKLGGTLRPDWDIPVMPSAGIAWQPVDQFRIEAMLPKSQIVLFPEHILSFFGTYEWRNVTYSLADEEGLPDTLTLDDMLVTAGIAFRPVADYTITGEYGAFIQREMSADVDANTAFDLSKETFIRVMIKGRF